MSILLRMLSWISGHTKHDIIRNESIRDKVVVALI